MPKSLKEAFSGGGGGLIKLEPDLDWQHTKTVRVVIDGNQQTMLSLSGRFAVSGLNLSFDSISSTTVKMVIDGETIINTSGSFGAFNIYGDSRFGSEESDLIPFLVESSLLVTVTRPSAGNIGQDMDLDYNVRAIK